MTRFVVLALALGALSLAPACQQAPAGSSASGLASGSASDDGAPPAPIAIGSPDGNAPAADGFVSPHAGWDSPSRMPAAVPGRLMPARYVPPAFAPQDALPAEGIPGEVIEGAGEVVEEVIEGVVASDPQPASDLRDSVMADRRRFLVQRKIDMAREQMRNGDYAAARRALEEAIDLEPQNNDARFMLREVESLLGDRGSNAAEYGRSRAMVTKLRIDEQRQRAAKLANMGRMHLANDRFDSAIEAFDDALFIMNTSPYSIDWSGLEQEARDGLRQAKQRKADDERARRRSAVEDSLGELAKMEEQELIQEMERLARWMGAAIESFERNQFDLAESYAERILDVQPDNTRARELVFAAQRASHDKRQVDFLREEKIRMREWLDDMNRTRIAQDRVLKWPSRKFWRDITRVRAKSRATFGEVDEDPEALALRQKVDAATVSVSVEEQTFAEVIRGLAIQTGFNIHIDARLTDLPEAPVTNLVLSDTRLATVLNMLRNQGGDENIVWTTKGNMVVFTSKEHINQNVTVEIHPVADLTAGLTDFIPPSIRLVGPDDVSDEENPIFGAEAEDPIFPYGQAEELIDLVKSAVEPTYWDEGGNIEANGERTLVVRATPEIQAQVADFLDSLRGFAGIVVTVESRFLEVSENFLRDVGVDFRGLGGTTPGNLVNLDDVTNGLEDQASAGVDNSPNGAPAAEALSPSAGAYFNDGSAGDFRARTENIFDNPLGTVLSSVGGATLSLTWLDDTQVSAIIRATEKTLSARTLTAPIITVFNTQRANLTMVNQVSYIQDFDVEVAQTSFIADPIVGIIQDGLTLDVRPTVSNDRRYITLELQPTVATLRRPIQEFATSLSSTFATVTIQLPELRLQQARTTVRIPDQGTILIGGLKEIRTVDRKSETPFLGKLPLLGTLFRRKGRSDEQSHLLILVRAEITDLVEQEEKFMDR